MVGCFLARDWSESVHLLRGTYIVQADTTKINLHQMSTVFFAAFSFVFCVHDPVTIHELRLFEKLTLSSRCRLLRHNYKQRDCATCLLKNSKNNLKSIIINKSKQLSITCINGYSITCVLWPLRVLSHERACGCGRQKWLSD